MNLTMVPSAQRDGELIADFAPERATLGEAQVMSIRRLPSANQASLLDDTPLPSTRPAPAAPPAYLVVLRCSTLHWRGSCCELGLRRGARVCALLRALPLCVGRHYSFWSSALTIARAKKPMHAPIVHPRMKPKRNIFRILAMMPPAFAVQAGCSKTER